jgi:hypothetical protein
VRHLDGDLFETHLVPAGNLKLPPGVAAKCWPTSLRDENARPVNAGQNPVAVFSPMSFDALTAFVAFEVSALDSTATKCRFVLNLPLEGAPVDRRQRTLQSLLGNREQVVRLLLLLLSDGGVEASDLLAGRSDERGGASFGLGSSECILESLLRALDRKPIKLDQVESFLHDLRGVTDVQQLLPEGFEQVWIPIWSVREKLRSDGKT